MLIHDLLTWLKEEPSEEATTKATDAPPFRESRSDEGIVPTRRHMGIGSRDYHFASLAVKMRVATTGTIPGVLPIQRELQNLLRSRDFDIVLAVRHLTQIEGHVAAERESRRTNVGGETCECHGHDKARDGEA